MVEKFFNFFEKKYLHFHFLCAIICRHLRERGMRW